MTFRSSVSLARRVPAGESVSYGHTWTAGQETTLALVPVGYADGVPRALSGQMEVWLGGARRPVVGRVCMDQIVVDCGDDPIADGDEVVLFGPGVHGEPTAREWADKDRTIDLRDRHRHVPAEGAAQLRRRQPMKPWMKAAGVTGGVVGAAGPAWRWVRRRRTPASPGSAARPTTRTRTSRSASYARAGSARSRPTTAWPDRVRGGRPGGRRPAGNDRGAGARLRAGPPLLALPAPANLAKMINPRVRLVLYDQRSHGRSGKATAESSTIEQLGRDLDAVLRALVPDGPIVLAGHSMGGMTIMALAEQRPELFLDRVRGVALIGTSAGDVGASGLPRPLLSRHNPTTRGLALLANLAARPGGVGPQGRRAASPGAPSAAWPSATARSAPSWST